MQLFENLKNNKLVVIAVLFIITVIALVLLFPQILMADFFQTLFDNFGFIGLFFGALFSNATILLPVPFDILIFALAVSKDWILFPVIAALFAGFGAAIGELTSYFMGFLGSKSIDKITKGQSYKMEDIKKKIGEYGMIFIFLGSFTPFPFDLIGIAAGLIKYDIKKFIMAAFLGKLTRYLVIGYSGMFSFSIVRTIFGF